jgi:hypothetical protein
MRTRLTQERTRCFKRLEKLLESALVKAVIVGQRHPRVLAGLGELAVMLLDQIAFLYQRIKALSARAVQGVPQGRPQVPSSTFCLLPAAHVKSSALSGSNRSFLRQVGRRVARGECCCRS